MQTTSLKIPYVNLAAQHAGLKVELLEAVEADLEKGNFILGEEVSQFEKRFSELCGVPYAVGVNSGTDALILALRVLGVGEGDEVITVPNSFVATAACIRLVDARPVFVDVRNDYNMDPERLERAVNRRTKAIIPVHLTGRPADMDPILALAGRKGIPVVEDAAQAVLAEYRGRRVGSFGTLGCFSMHPLKTLNACGDGGVLTTSDSRIYEELKVLRNLGLKDRNQCLRWSGNSRLDTIQAAMLLVKLKYLETWTGKRRANAAFYQRKLSGVAGLSVPQDQPFERAVYHAFVILCDRRDELKEFLKARGIETAVHYPIPIHLQEAAKELGHRRGDFPVAERQAQRILSLPIYPELMEIDQEYIVSNVRQFYGDPST